MKFFALTTVAVMFFLLFSPGLKTGLFQTTVSYAQPDWKKDFDDICVKTNDAMDLPDDELRALIARADRLKPAIEALEGAEKKLYLRRLQQCRDLFEFVLSSRKKG